MRKIIFCGCILLSITCDAQEQTNSVGTPTQESTSESVQISNEGKIVPTIEAKTPEKRIEKTREQKPIIEKKKEE